MHFDVQIDTEMVQKMLVAKSHLKIHQISNSIPAEVIPAQLLQLSLICLVCVQGNWDYAKQTQGGKSLLCVWQHASIQIMVQLNKFIP